jgi:hypothetical protein
MKALSKEMDALVKAQPPPEPERASRQLRELLQWALDLFRRPEEDEPEDEPEEGYSGLEAAENSDEPVGDTETAAFLDIRLPALPPAKATEGAKPWGAITRRPS